jgi:chromate transporter
MLEVAITHMWLWCGLFWRFLVISLVAFGGSGSALSLVERTAVREAGWVDADGFAAALGSSYVMPGPILMMATFIGYRVDGLPGAMAATLGVFLMPWLIASSAAWLLNPYLQSRWLLAFGGGAGAAVVGLQLVTAYDLARDAFTGWLPALLALIASGLSLGTKLHPVLMLFGGALIGMIGR